MLEIHRAKQISILCSSDLQPTVGKTMKIQIGITNRSTMSLQRIIIGMQMANPFFIPHYWSYLDNTGTPYICNDASCIHPHEPTKSTSNPPVCISNTTAKQNLANRNKKEKRSGKNFPTHRTTPTTTRNWSKSKKKKNSTLDTTFCKNPLALVFHLQKNECQWNKY